MKTIANDNEAYMMSTNDKLFQAIKLNNFWQAHVLLVHGADLNITNAEGLNPIEYALKLGFNKMVEFLKSIGDEHETTV